jgi:hypothetical protein
MVLSLAGLVGSALIMTLPGSLGIMAPESTDDGCEIHAANGTDSCFFTCIEGESIGVTGDGELGTATATCGGVVTGCIVMGGTCSSPVEPQAQTDISGICTATGIDVTSTCTAS